MMVIPFVRFFLPSPLVRGPHTYVAFGLRHWMEHALRIDPDTMQAPNKETEDSIIILMDPDMILLRPITHDYSDVENHIWADDKSTPLTRVVRHGYPMAQQVRNNDTNTKTL